MKNLFFLTMVLSLFTLSFGAMATGTGEGASDPGPGADLCGEDATAKGTTPSTTTTTTDAQTASEVKSGTATTTP